MKKIIFMCGVMLLFLGGIGFVHAIDEYPVIDVIQTTNPVKIDGNLDDEPWQKPGLEKEFITYSPKYGDIFPYKTILWLSYDSKNLYFAMKCYDPEPDKIKTSITKRDNIWNDDWVGFSLDAIGDGQSFYNLFVNPNGIQGDTITSRSGGDDDSPDWVWSSAGKITKEGYQVEFKLPLKSIRFKSGNEVKMRIMFWRKISHLGIEGAWPAWDRSKTMYECMIDLKYKNIKSAKVLEILPSFTYSSSRDRDDNQQWLKHENSTNFGIGIKYGILSSLTTQLTVNPDFSQVESDAFQVSVNQRYPIFFTEKRPFFMESKGLFNIAGTGGEFNMYTAVHTRRIVDPKWGARLTGNFGNTTLGLLASSDKYPGQEWEYETNPNQGKSAFYSILRLKQGLGQGNYLGLLYTRRDFAGQYNQVFGGDMKYHLSGPHNISFNFLRSNTKNTEGASGQIGNNFVLNYDFYKKYLNFWVCVQHISKDFQMDTAFYNRVGITMGSFAIEPMFVPSSNKLSWIKRISPIIYGRALHDINTGMNDSLALFGLRFNFIKQGMLRFDFMIDNESWINQVFHQKRIRLITQVQLYKWLYLWGNYAFGDRIYYDPVDPYMGKNSNLYFYMKLQPFSRLSESLSVEYVAFNHPETKAKVYDSLILNSETAYQFNKYFFIRGNIRYDSYYKNVLTDCLASFTLIPGTVVHVGYGSLFEKRNCQTVNSRPFNSRMIQTRQSFFLKASYLWRL